MPDMEGPRHLQHVAAAQRTSRVLNAIVPERDQQTAGHPRRARRESRLERAIVIGYVCSA